MVSHDDGDDQGDGGHVMMMVMDKRVVVMS